MNAVTVNHLAAARAHDFAFTVDSFHVRFATVVPQCPRKKDATFDSGLIQELF